MSPEWKWRGIRCGERGRFPSTITLEVLPTVKKLIPDPMADENPIIINPAELEAMRLVDMEGLTQEMAARKMGVSRGTVWRLLDCARRKITAAIYAGRPVIIDSKGVFSVDSGEEE